ncbi:hypothetical protein O0L34_g11218 [Tuta absoluta]|nr:hypothetical protein O0L34_g11218 [Tuta absoluta]
MVLQGRVEEVVVLKEEALVVEEALDLKEGQIRAVEAHQVQNMGRPVKAVDLKEEVAVQVDLDPHHKEGSVLVHLVLSTGHLDKVVKVVDLKEEVAIQVDLDAHHKEDLLKAEVHPALNMVPPNKVVPVDLDLNKVDLAKGVVLVLHLVLNMVRLDKVDLEALAVLEAEVPKVLEVVAKMQVVDRNLHMALQEAVKVQVDHLRVVLDKVVPEVVVLVKVVKVVLDNDLNALKARMDHHLPAVFNHQEADLDLVVLADELLTEVRVHRKDLIHRMVHLVLVAMAALMMGKVVHRHRHMVLLVLVADRAVEAALEADRILMEANLTSQLNTSLAMKSTIRRQVLNLVILNNVMVTLLQGNITCFCPMAGSRWSSTKQVCRDTNLR